MYGKLRENWKSLYVLVYVITKYSLFVVYDGYYEHRF